MRIVHIKTKKVVEKTKDELEEESRVNPDNRPFFINNFKEVPLKKPTYIVEMTMEEIQLVNFYLEVEKRKPITEIKIAVPKAKSL